MRVKQHLNVLVSDIYFKAKRPNYHLKLGIMKWFDVVMAVYVNETRGRMKSVYENSSRDLHWRIIT